MTHELLALVSRGLLFLSAWLALAVAAGAAASRFDAGEGGGS